MSAYLTDVRPFTPVYYVVSAFDAWDNASIGVFNVTDDYGSVFYAFNGSAVVVSDNETNDLTVRALDYFVAFYSGHNTSSNLSAYLNQSFIVFDARTVFTNESVQNVTFQVSDGNTTRNFTGVANLKAGVYNVTTFKTGYSGVTKGFNVSALDNKTVLVEGLFTSNLTIVPRAVISNGSYTGLNITLSRGSYNQTYVNVSNASFLIVKGIDYNISVDGAQIALYEEVFNTNLTGGITHYVYVYAYNSLWVYAVDPFTLNNISSFNVTVQDASVQYKNSTSSGRVIFDGLLSSVYTVLVASPGYVTAEYTITIDDNSHQDLYAYLANSTQTVTFTLKGDDDNKLIEGALFTQKAFINGTLTTISSSTTDVIGTSSFAVIPDVIYTFVVTKSGYETKTFTLKPVLSDYVVLLQKSTTLNESVYVDDVSTRVYDSNIKNAADANVRVGFSSGGQLTDYFVNMSFYDDYSYVSGSSATGGVLKAVINLSNASLGDVVVVTYGYKSSVNAGYVTFTRVYTINQWSYVDTSLVNARDYFGSYGYVERALIGTAIALLFAAMFVAGAGLSSMNMFIGASLGGIFGFGLAAYLGLFTWAVFSVVAFVLGVIVVSNVRGKN